MMKAMIFDFDGTIADTETHHLRAYQEVLSGEGVTLSDEDYYASYLAMNDRDCLRTVLEDRGIQVRPEKLADLCRKKADYYGVFLSEHPPFFPGVVTFIREMATLYPLAIASGALRDEITFILEGGGLDSAFVGIVSAEDVTNGKPDPEGFIKALDLINRQARRAILPAECLVFEDSIHGIAAAHAAGMNCVAIANSYPPSSLSQADEVVASLEGYKPKDHSLGGAAW